MTTIFRIFGLLALAASSLYGQQVLYDNGPALGTDRNSPPVVYSMAATDSFVLTSPARVTGIVLNLMSVDVAQPLAGRWTIYNSTGHIVSTAYVPLELLGTAQFDPYEIYTVKFLDTNVPLDAGVYTLQISDVHPKVPFWVRWDENAGINCSSFGCPSIATSQEFGGITVQDWGHYVAIGSESFQITGEFE